MNLGQPMFERPVKSYDTKTIDFNSFINIRTAGKNTVVVFVGVEINDASDYRKASGKNLKHPYTIRFGNANY